MADAQQFAGSNQRQPQEYRISLNPSQELGFGELEILQAGVYISLAFVVQKFGQAEAFDEPPDLSRRHRLQLQIHQLDQRPALLEEPIGGAGRLRVFQAEDLDAQRIA